MLDNFINYAPTIGLLFFFVVFIIIAAWTFRPNAKSTYEEKAYIPMKEEENDS